MLPDRLGAVVLVGLILSFGAYRLLIGWTPLWVDLMVIAGGIAWFVWRSKANSRSGIKR